MSKNKKKVIVYSSSEEGDFEDVCSAHIENGYEIISSSCGFLNSEYESFKSFYQAIFKLKEKEK